MSREAFVVLHAKPETGPSPDKVALRERLERIADAISFENFKTLGIPYKELDDLDPFTRSRRIVEARAAMEQTLREYGLQPEARTLPKWRLILIAMLGAKL
jgi:hypothetical protein